MSRTGRTWGYGVLGNTPSSADICDLDIAGLELGLMSMMDHLGSGRMVSICPCLHFETLGSKKNREKVISLLGMIPGAGKLKGLKVDNKAFVQIEAIINSMTLKERAKHNIINASRKRRIAQGSGTRVNDINKLLKQFTQMQKMMKKVSRGGGLNFGSLMGGGGFMGR